MFFKIKLGSSLKKLMEVYTERQAQGGTPGTYQFTFDSLVISGTQTPNDVRDQLSIRSLSLLATPPSARAI